MKRLLSIILVMMMLAAPLSVFVGAADGDFTVTLSSSKDKVNSVGEAFTLYAEIGDIVPDDGLAYVELQITWDETEFEYIGGDDSGETAVDVFESTPGTGWESVVKAEAGKLSVTVSALSADAWIKDADALKIKLSFKTVSVPDDGESFDITAEAEGGETVNLGAFRKDAEDTLAIESGLATLPADAIVITHYSNYTRGDIVNILVNGGTEAKSVVDLCTRDWNVWYMIIADAEGKVTDVCQRLGRGTDPYVNDGRKSLYMVPAGGFVIVADSEQATDAAKMLDIKVNDTINLYNIDLVALAQLDATVGGDASANQLTQAGFTYTSYTYPVGVTNQSNATEVGTIAGDSWDKLNDGKVSEPVWGVASDGFIINNKMTTDAHFNPMVDFVINYGSAQEIRQVVLDFFCDYNSMVALPKDLKVYLSYSTDGKTFTSWKESGFTFTSSITDYAAGKGKVTAEIDVDYKTAQYVQVQFEFGANPNENPGDGKVVWEWIGMSEVTLVEYTAGVYLTGDDDVSTIGDMATLTDGVKATGVAWSSPANNKVVLFNNAKCTEAGVYPTAEVLWVLDEETVIGDITLSFYNSYDVMIGNPADNKVKLSYSTDGETFSTWGTFVLDLTDPAAGTHNVKDVTVNVVDKKASYIKMEFSYGDSPFAEATPSKPVWEFFALSEVAYSEGDDSQETLPAEAFVLTDYAGRASPYKTIMKNNGDTADTVKNVFAAAGQTGNSINFQYWYMVLVDENNIVTEVGKNGVVKDDVSIPAGGYIMMVYFEVPSGDLWTNINKIEVGAEITLYNIELDALALANKTAKLTNAGFTYKNPAVADYSGYAAGVHLVGDDNVGTIGDLASLLDGKKADAKTWSSPADNRVVLFQNKACTTAGVYPTASVLLVLDASTLIKTLDLSFYNDYSVMIGAPADNKVKLSYSTDGKTFTSWGEHTLGLTAPANGAYNADDVTVDVTDANAKYIMMEFSYGDSPFADATPSKPVWEFFAMSEIDYNVVVVTDPVLELKDNVEFAFISEDGKYLMNISEKMSADDVKALFKDSTGMTVETNSSNGYALNGGKITLGDETLTMIMFGDIVSDGVINAQDYFELKKHYLKVITLTGASFEAGCIHEEGKIQSIDYFLLKKHVLKVEDLKDSVAAR